MYANDEIMAEIANLMEDFDEDDLLDIFRDQILGTDAYDVVPIDHLQSLNSAYERAKEIEGVDEDDLHELKQKYYTVCIAINDYIAEKYGIVIDSETYMSDCVGDLPGLTYAMYKFFILDAFDNILEMVCSFIGENLDKMYDTFEDGVQRDVSTIINSKTVSPKYATIVSHIYDIIGVAFELVDTETWFTYTTPEYVPGKILQMMLDRGIVQGDFVYAMKQMYRSNFPFKSKLGMEIVFKIKELGYLPVSNTFEQSDTLNPEPPA